MSYQPSLLHSRGLRRFNRLPAKIVLFVFVLFSLIPFAWMLTASLEPVTSLYGKTFDILPHPLTLHNYATLLHPGQTQGADFPRYFLNSIIVVLGTVVASLVVAVPAAYGFSRFRFRGRQSIMYTVLLQGVFPLVNFLIPLYIIMNRFHLLNSYYGLIIGYLTFSLPLNMWILKSFFDGIPPDMETAARLDGASRFRAFVEMALPPALPGIVATAIYTFILAWDEYLYALTMINSSSMRTLPLGLYEFFSEGQPNWGELTAVAIAMSIPVVVVFIVLQRYFVTALTKGALKY